MQEKKEEGQVRRGFASIAAVEERPSKGSMFEGAPIGSGRQVASAQSPYSTDAGGGTADGHTRYEASCKDARHAGRTAIAAEDF